MTLGLPPGADGHQPGTSSSHALQEKLLQQQLQTILRGIDELTETTLKANVGASSLPSTQAALMQFFKKAMHKIKGKAYQASHEIEIKLAPNVHADSQLEDLVGVDAGSDLNRRLGTIKLKGRPSYKLRDFTSGAEAVNLIVDQGPVTFPPPQGLQVVLLPTLRNVWVLQHAFASILRHKESLIQEYLDAAGSAPGVKRKFVREYYEQTSLMYLPQKQQLGNLIDVKSSPYTHETHDLTLILQFQDHHDGSPRYEEPVTGEIIHGVDQTDGGGNSYLILPAVEASLQKLYGAYRAARVATSNERQATKDGKVAAALRADAGEDAMESLEQQFSSIGGPDFHGTGGDVGSRGENSRSKKRRRVLDDDAGQGIRQWLVKLT
ncbi:hypothetical protein Hte_011761 [Hypoxylon texense]